MSLFLLRFDRQTRRVIVDRFDDERAALAELAVAEREAREDTTLEVVLLTADDEADLHKTHARYFESFDELLAGVES